MYGFYGDEKRMYGFCGDDNIWIFAGFNKCMGFMVTKKECMGFLVMIIYGFCADFNKCMGFMVTKKNVWVLWWRKRRYGFYGEDNKLWVYGDFN
jgi:hypothetical protein